MIELKRTLTFFGSNHNPNPNPNRNYNPNPKPNLRKGKKLKRKKKGGGEPSGSELQNSLTPALPLYDSPTNCARWQFVANIVIFLRFIAHHQNHETISQSFSDKVLLSSII